ncbi:MAG: hypothetical protein EXS64_13935 [Candidatus Latescibacteria bacterium]|nr:hypothetical protein [Candidatus Latescibacterota bacterium]
MKTSVSSISTRLPWIVFAVWFLAYFGARGLLEHGPAEAWQRVGVALLPVPFFAVFLVTFIRRIGSMDELQRRIQLEALAVAFPLALLLLMTLGLLQRAIHLPFEDWSYAHVWPYLPIFYFIGLAVASRRYR